MAGITYPDKNYHIIRKHSTIYCMEYIIDGVGYVSIDNKTFTVGKGDVYILPINKSHNYYSDEKNPFTKIWFNVSGSLCNALINVYQLEGVHHIKNIPHMYVQFQKFLSICENKTANRSEIFGECARILDEHYFSNVFKKSVGVSPGIFKRK